jgi:hypothetical protein
MIHTMKQIQPAIAALFFLAAAGAFGAETRLYGGDSPLEEAPESAEIRVGYWESFLSAPRDKVLAFKPKVIATEAGSFELRSIETRDFFYAVVSAAKGKDHPLYSQGTWIVKRSMKNGAFIQAKIFTRSDPGTFLRIYPAQDRSRMDVVVYGGAVNREVPIPLPFDKLLKMPLSEIMRWTASSVDWELFSPRPGLYAQLRGLSAAIRKELPGLRYVDDGGIDAGGQAIFIESGLPQTGRPGLNCSGFAEWVADGLYRPLSGGFLDPARLKEKHTELRENGFSAAVEEKYEPFFGLDWTRNIARALADARSPSRSHGILESDVRLSPFALYGGDLEAGNGGPLYASYPAYQEGVGYQIKGLKSILYLLAMREPGNLYFASISRLDKTGLRRHDHVAVLIPYFRESGQFQVDVFESASETGIEALMSRAPRDFVHLVRVAADSSFEPPPLR